MVCSKRRCFILMGLLCVVISVDCQDCDNLNDPSNGMVTMAGTTLNDTASYSCNIGYTLVGAETRNCDEDGMSGAEWEPEEPVCCSDLNDPANGTVVFSKTVENVTATYSCNSGYEINGQMIRTCDTNGNWSPTEPVCVVSCGPPPPIANGSPGRPTSTAVDGIVTYNCDIGYTRDFHTSRCIRSGWSNLANCTAIDCGLLLDPANGQVDTSSGTTFMSNATYNCNTGYILNGDMTRTCGADGIWSLTVPTCNPADCGSLSNPTNGQVDTSSGTTFMNTATYSCDSGYELIGEMTRTCDTDGNWSLAEPVCDFVTCGSLTNPINGQVDISLSFGSTLTTIATYTCNYGYELIGSMTRTCGTDGQWTPAEPVCEDMLTPIGSGSGSGDPDVTTEIPTTMEPPLTEGLPALSIQFTFFVSRDEFNTTIMEVLLEIVRNITSTDAEIVLLIDMEMSNENTTVTLLFFESTDTADGTDITRDAYSALMSTNNLAWLLLKQEYNVTTTLVVEPTPTQSPEPISLTIWQWVIVTVAATALMLALLMIVSCCCHCLVMRGRKKPAKGYKRHTLTGSDLPYHRSPKPAMEMSGFPGQPRKVTRITLRPKGMLQQLSHPLTMDELEAISDNTAALYGEYASIPSNMVTMSEVPPGAEDKNRYRDVLPNPYTRVSLFLKFGVSNSDYINANFIRGYKDSSKSYIATQGPLQWTVADFWRMIWEQKVSTVIMVTGLEERGTNKCTRYWPDETINHSTTYEGLEVRLKRRMTASNKDCVTTTFHLAHKLKMVSREVTHYWFTGWPDHGVPSSAKPVVEFLLQAKNHIREMPGPTVVHCSAGIGRTGVFIGADIGMQQMEEEGQVDVLKIVSTLRQDRGGMVQTRDQYIFLHKVLLEYAHYLSQVRSTYRAGFRGQGSFTQLQPTIEEESTDSTVLLR